MICGTAFVWDSNQFAAVCVSVCVLCWNYSIWGINITVCVSQFAVAVLAYQGHIKRPL